ncbi:MAG: hypothetical protein ACLGIC_12470 [Acidimicrobiia bacterium]
MAKPQQPELRRSGFVPALDPDATESDLEAHERPKAKGGKRGPIPEEQQPGHHPEHEQDKPDLDKFAERMGIVPEGEEPEDAPHVEDDDASTVTRLEDAPSKVKARRQEDEPAQPEARSKAGSKDERRTFSPIGLALVGPVTTVLVVRRVVRLIRRKR